MNDQVKHPGKLRSFANEFVLLLRSIPSPTVAFFVVSVIAMNLLANKTIVDIEFLAIDGGILVSWLSFLCMDVVTKHFGPKASTVMSVFAMLVNLVTCGIFFLVSIIPTEYDYSAFNSIIGGTWFILLSSTIAFLCSALINNFLNYSLGKMFRSKKDGAAEFIVRSYVSTFVGQFFDNFIFSALTFMLFAPIFWDGFSWSFIQCVTCSLIGAFLELVMEIIFSPIGYYVSRKWKAEGVGEAYFNYIRGVKNENTDNRNI